MAMVISPEPRLNLKREKKLSSLKICSRAILTSVLQVLQRVQYRGSHVLHFLQPEEQRVQIVTAYDKWQ